MKNDNKYNGWTNYETWRVNIECFDGWEDNLEPDEARLMVESIIEEDTSEGIARDYAMAFIDQVNWQEIAEHYNGEESE